MMKYHSLFVSLLLVFQLGVRAGVGPGIIDKVKSDYRVHYVGIGADTLFSLDGDPVLSPFSCADVNRVGTHIQRFAKGNDSFTSYSSCGELNKEQLREMFRKVNISSQSDEYFVFYFGGFTQKVKTPRGVVTGFFIHHPELKNTNEVLENVDSATYFTIAELRIWLNAIPPRNQMVLIEAGFTTELKREFTKMLIETNDGISNLENRKRILLFPQGVGIEDFDLKAGRFTWTMTSGLEKSGRNLLDVFRPGYTESFEFECWRSYVSVNVHASPLTPNLGFNLIKEWEMQELLGPRTGNKRGENIAVKPKNGVPLAKDSLPRFFAFICGTNHYDFLDPLNNPEADADGVSEVLKTKYGFHTKVIKDPANVGDFMGELKAFIDSVAFNVHDELLVFIAGHGVYHPFSDAGFIAFSNSKTDLAMSTYLEHRRLINILDNLPCKKVMLILDVCFGGSLSQGLVAQSDSRLCNSGKSAMVGTWPYISGSSNLVFQNLNCANRVYLTSGGFEYVDDGIAGAHSPFAGAFIKALEENQQEVLFSMDINGAVKRTMLQQMPAGSQMPTYGRFGLDNNSTDFIFVRKP